MVKRVFQHNIMQLVALSNAFPSKLKEKTRLSLRLHKAAFNSSPETPD